ncbi:MAG: hypothetical protein ACJA2S_003718, partial [Cyclobacteriaceae bacterium]
WFFDCCTNYIIQRIKYTIYLPPDFIILGFGDEIRLKTIALSLVSKVSVFMFSTRFLSNAKTIFPLQKLVQLLWRKQ